MAEAAEPRKRRDMKPHERQPEGRSTRAGWKRRQREAVAAPGLQNKTAKAGGEGTGPAWRLGWRNEPKRRRSCDLAERPNAGGMWDATGGLWRGDERDEGDGVKQNGGVETAGPREARGRAVEFQTQSALCTRFA
jgi:hypothetical protein